MDVSSAEEGGLDDLIIKDVTVTIFQSLKSGKFLLKGTIVLVLPVKCHVLFCFVRTSGPGRV